MLRQLMTRLTRSSIRVIGLGLLTFAITVTVSLMGSPVTQWLDLPRAVAVPTVTNGNGSDNSGDIAPTPNKVAPVSPTNYASPALQITLNPMNPQVGDTLQVVIRQNNPSVSSVPQVTLGKKLYPAFPRPTNAAINGQGNSQPKNNIYTWRALIPTTPLDAPGPKQLVINDGVSPSQVINFTLANREFPTQSLWIDQSGNSLEPTDAEWDKVSAFKKIVTPQKMWQGKFLRPNEGEVTTVFGVRRYYNGVFAEDYYHRGVDYGGGYGSPVIAPAGGVVRLVGYVDQGFRLHGNTVGIDHGQGVLSIFLHLSKILVREGDMVTPGQVIGELGSTGAATGPHLHWGLYVQGEAIDPTPWRYGDID